MTDIFTPSARKAARRARRQEENRAKTIALIEELCRQNERFHGEETAWRIQLDKVASRLVDAGTESPRCHSGN